MWLEFLAKATIDNLLKGDLSRFSLPNIVLAIADVMAAIRILYKFVNIFPHQNMYYMV